MLFLYITCSLELPCKSGLVQFCCSILLLTVCPEFFQFHITVLLPVSNSISFTRSLCGLACDPDFPINTTVAVSNSSQGQTAATAAAVVHYWQCHDYHAFKTLLRYTFPISRSRLYNVT